MLRCKRSCFCPRLSPASALEFPFWRGAERTAGTPARLISDTVEAEDREGDRTWSIGAIDVATGQEFYWGVDQGEGSIEHGLRFLSDEVVLMADLYHDGLSRDQADRREQCHEFNRRCRGAIADR